MSDRVAFLDLETSGLVADRYEVLEVGIVSRTFADRVEYSWPIRPLRLDLEDPQTAGALRVNQWRERFAHVPASRMRTAAEVLPSVARVLDGAIVAIWCPFDARLATPEREHFDARFLLAAFRRSGLALEVGRWVNLARNVGRVLKRHVKKGRCAPKLGKCAELLGVPVEDDDVHTALGDARLLEAVANAIEWSP